MGNRRDGDVAVNAWENLLDLSHSVYSRCRHPLIFNTYSDIYAYARIYEKKRFENQL